MRIVLEVLLKSTLHPKIIIAQGPILAYGFFLGNQRIHTDYFGVIQWKNPIRMVSERNRICYDR